MLSVYISMIWIAASLLASALNPSIDAFRNVVYISLMALFASFMLHIQRSRQAIRIARYSGLSFCNTAECIVGRNGFAFLLIIGLAIAASCFNSGALLPVFVCYCFIHMICFGALALHYFNRFIGNGKIKLGIFTFIQIAIKAVSLALIVGTTYATYQYTVDLMNRLPRTAEWETYENEYGVVPDLFVGEDEKIIFDQVNQNDLAINGELYTWLNHYGAIYCRQDADVNGVPTLYVNPNYLSIIPVIDAVGGTVNISEDETDIIILSPLEASQDSKIMDFFRERRNGMLKLERQYAVPQNTHSEAIQIIHIKPSQRLFTFRPDTEYCENAIVCVLTEKNSLITERVCITGNGVLDPLKIYIGSGSDEYKLNISKKLAELGLDDNIQSIVSLRQSIDALRREWKSRMTALGMVIVFLFLSQLISNVLTFRAYIKRAIPLITLKYINGYSAFKRYAVYYFIMIFQIILTVLICCVRQMSFEFGLVWCALDIGEYYLLKKIALRYEKRMRSEYIKEVNS